MNPQAQAAKLLSKILVEKCSLDIALVSQRWSSPQKPLIQEMCYGVMRWYFRLAPIADLLLEKPFKDKDADIYALILIGLYQILGMRIPSHAAVNETVTAVVQLKKPWAKSLMNAVLRNFLRRQEPILQDLDQDVQAKFAHPLWLIKKIQNAWPDDWQAILIANNQYPPMTLRVNSQQMSRDSYINLLKEHDILCAPCVFADQGIYLENSVGVEKLPGFSEGVVSVQDEAAQLVADLFKLKPGMEILDACAAPGGKACHLLEKEPTLKLTAVEKNHKRMQKIEENLKRLNLSAKVICADAADTKTWWDGTLFDAILIDAPCSATGVIRRHPDIKFLRRDTDLENLASQQLHLLQSLWPLLKPQGLLVYVTCSVLPDENDQVISTFLKSNSECQISEVKTAWGRVTQHGRQVLPGEDGMDGFYFGLLSRP